MKYKVGDKVKIREGLIEDEDYDDVDFVEGMEEFMGKVATIISSNEKGYRIDIDENEWCWSDGMIEDYIELPEKDIVENTTVRTEPNIYKELASLLLEEIKLLDRGRYDDLLHCITILRPDLSKIVL